MEIKDAIGCELKMPEWLKRVLEKVDEPQRSLQHAYDRLRSEIIKTRQKLVASMAKEKNLENKLTDRKLSPEQTAFLETELITQKAETVKLRLRLETIESEIQQTYTKKQLWQAKRKSQQEWTSSDPTRPIMVIIAVMTVWALIGVLLNLKNHY